jgi:two-component system OmpR family response regulator
MAAPLTGVSRILIADDEAHIREVVRYALERDGHRVELAGDGAAALARIAAGGVDLVILDVLMPELDGLSLCRRIRARGRLPIIFLSSRTEEADRILGLDLGGDDYVTKPFSLEELVARLRALLRRMGITRAQQGSTLSVADLTMDEESREVRRGDTLIELTPTEFELLRYLMRNPRRVLSKAQILDRVWRYDFGGQGNVVELYVGYLRRKIDKDRMPLIHTVRGVGYVLRPPQ